MTETSGPIMPVRGIKWDGTIPELRKWPPTATGRRARGELEDTVDMLCKRWIMVDLPAGVEDCTSEWLAKEATKLDGRNTSTGGITGILRRWDELGYAIIEDGPTRFVSFTAKGMQVGLQEMARRAKVRARSAAHYQWPDKGDG